MDPNAALLDLREALREYEHAAELSAIAVAAERLAAAASALDEWLSKGGFLPAAWGALSRTQTDSGDFSPTIPSRPGVA